MDKIVYESSSENSEEGSNEGSKEVVKGVCKQGLPSVLDLLNDAIPKSFTTQQANEHRRP